MVLELLLLLLLLLMVMAGGSWQIDVACTAGLRRLAFPCASHVAYEAAGHSYGPSSSS